MLVGLAGALGHDQPLKHILTALADYIVRETGAIAAAAVLLDRRELTIVEYGRSNLPDGYVERVMGARSAPDDMAAFRRRIDEDRLWVIRDARNGLLTEPVYAGLRTFALEVAWDTVVAIPFRCGRDAVGVVYFYYDPATAVDDAETGFARAIAQQAAPVMLNAWLFGESERRTSELEALSRADAAMHQSLRLDDVLQAMVDLAVELLGADQSAPVTWAPGDRLSVRASRGLSEGEVGRLNAAYSVYERKRFVSRIPDMALVEDVAAETRLDPRTRTNSPSASIVELPIAVAGQLFGFFTIGYVTRRAFDPTDRRLFDTLSGRAGLAIQNALLFEASTAQTRELDARVEQLEALHRADSAMHKSLRLQDVYQAMIDLAIDLLGADEALLATVGGDGRLVLQAVRGMDESQVAALSAVYRGRDPERYAGFVPMAILVEDVQTDPHVEPAVRKFLPAASFADLPIVLGQQLFGFFSIGYNARRSFTEVDRRLFDTLSTRAAIAIQNALLYEQSAAQTVELEARVRQMEALSTIAASLTLHVGESRVYDELAGQVLRATSALACAVIVLDDDAESLRMLGTAGLPEGFAGAMDEAYALGAESRARAGILRGEPGILHNARLESFIDERYARPREMVAHAAWDTMVSRPLIYHDRPLGMLVACYPADWEVDDEEVSFLAAIADQGAVAVANAGLMEAASNLAASEERQRLARELHDSVSQALYGIALGAKTARKRMGDRGDPLVAEAVDYVLALAEAGLTETRALIFELIPESLANEGLAVAIRRQAAATQARHQIAVHIDLGEEPDLPIKTKEAMYRIAQESLNNVAKHARAENAFVTLAAGNGTVRLEVRDDGAGFDPTGDFPGHLGLVSMEERARRIGATYAIRSSPGSGATVTLTVPA